MFCLPLAVGTRLSVNMIMLMLVISQTAFILSIAINRAKHVCAIVINKYNYMLMCNHKIMISIQLCLLNSTGLCYTIERSQLSSLFNAIYNVILQLHVITLLVELPLLINI